MPFGLVNAPSTFQRAMSVALRGCEDFTVVYIDDILIFSETLEDHFQHLDRVFACLKSQSYHARLSKCKFVTTEVPFLLYGTLFHTTIDCGLISLPSCSQVQIAVQKLIEGERVRELGRPPKGKLKR